jgi:hypothetical protein
MQLCNGLRSVLAYLYILEIYPKYLKSNKMKNLLYIIAGLILVIWGILFWGLHASGAVHLLLAVAGSIVLIRLIFSKQLTPKKVKL